MPVILLQDLLRLGMHIVFLARLVSYGFTWNFGVTVKFLCNINRVCHKTLGFPNDVLCEYVRLGCERGHVFLAFGFLQCSAKYVLLNALEISCVAFIVRGCHLRMVYLFSGRQNC